MEKQPAAVLENQAQKVAQRCEDVQSKINRDEVVIGKMVEYLLKNKPVNVDKLDFCKDFRPAISVETPVLSIPIALETVSCPFQLQTKTVHLINNEIVICLKLVNSSTKILSDISGTVIFENDESDVTFLENRSVLLEFADQKENYMGEHFHKIWPKYFPVQCTLVRPGQCVYLVVGILPPELPTLLTILMNCSVTEVEPVLHFSLETHKWRRWNGDICKFECNPCELDLPTCLTDSGIFSPVNFLMSLCALTAFAQRRILKLANKAALQTILDHSAFKWNKISGQSSIYYSSLYCIKRLLIFIKFSDNLNDAVHIITASWNETTLNLFMNKLASLNVDFEECEIEHKLDSEDRLKSDLLNKEIDILEKFKIDVAKENVLKDGSVISVDGNIYRNFMADLVSLELQRLASNN